LIPILLFGGILLARIIRYTKNIMTNSIPKKWLCLLVSVAFLSASLAYSRDFMLRKKAGNLIVEMRIDRNPPVVAENEITLGIKDLSGKNVTDAKVIVNYYMPPMPGMPPMNYNTIARLHGQEYRAVMDLIMAGPWNIVVKIYRGGKFSRLVFSIDVR
jgi:hypothetical protein